MPGDGHCQPACDSAGGHWLLSFPFRLSPAGSKHRRPAEIRPRPPEAEPRRTRRCRRCCCCCRKSRRPLRGHGGVSPPQRRGRGCCPPTGLWAVSGRGGARSSDLVAHPGTTHSAGAKRLRAWQGSGSAVGAAAPALAGTGRLKGVVIQVGSAGGPSRSPPFGYPRGPCDTWPPACGRNGVSWWGLGARRYPPSAPGVSV